MTTHDHLAGEPYLALSLHSAPPRLTIERIETVALRVPLHKRYSGSAYSMVNRCTIVTRLYTHEGIIGEVYTGDTDAEQDIIVRIIHEELAPDDVLLRVSITGVYLANDSLMGIESRDDR